MGNNEVGSFGGEGGSEGGGIVHTHPHPQRVIVRVQFYPASKASAKYTYSVQSSARFEEKKQPRHNI